MKIKIIYYNVMSPYNDGIEKYTDETIEINDKTTLKDIFINSKVNADVSKYYKLSSNYYYNHRRLPYIRKENNVVIWEPSYEEVKVIDFIFTHDIKDNIIYADIGIPQAGGPDLKDFIHLWNDYFPIIDQIASIFGFIDGTIRISMLLKSIFIDKRKKVLPPHGVLDIILSRKQWNHNELSEILGIEKGNAKMFLKALGYTWDNSKKLHVLQCDPNELRDKLSKVQFWEHG